MNRINELFKSKKSNILSVYFTAGFPNLNDTVNIIKELEAAGVDMIEIGMPFSDPLADGPVIQNSSTIALSNGMSLNILFDQLKDIRSQVSIPLVLMGYVNPVLQYGYEKFCKKCKEVGIDGLIIPDLPISEYTTELKPYTTANGLSSIFLISPQTSDERIRLIDRESDGFIYVVSTSATTGAIGRFSDDQISYFLKVNQMNLSNPLMVGFGISNNNTFESVCKYANGAIIGSAFINALKESKDLKTSIHSFVNKIRG